MNPTFRSMMVILAGTTLMVAAQANQQPSTGAAASQTTSSPAKPTLNLQTPIEQLMADPAARDAVESVLPGIANHRRYEEFKSMSFEELQPMAPNMLTPEKLSRIADALAQIGKPAQQK